MRWKYSKLLMNLGNAAEALCGPSARVSEIARLARAEGLASLGAAGIEFVSDEGFAERRGDLIRPQAIGGGPRPGGSSWQSLARGTGRIEADYLNGCLLYTSWLCAALSARVVKRGSVRRSGRSMARQRRPKLASDPATTQTKRPSAVG